MGKVEDSGLLMVLGGAYGQRPNNRSHCFANQVYPRMKSCRAAWWMGKCMATSHYYLGNKKYHWRYVVYVQVSVGKQQMVAQKIDM